MQQLDAAGVDSSPAANLAAVVQDPEPFPGVLNDSLYAYDPIFRCDREVLAVNPRVTRYRLLRLLRDLLVPGPGGIDDHFLKTRIRLIRRMLGQAMTGRSEERDKEHPEMSAAKGMLPGRRCKPTHLRPP